MKVQRLTTGAGSEEREPHPGVSSPRHAGEVEAPGQGPGQDQGVRQGVQSRGWEVRLGPQVSISQMLC